MSESGEEEEPLWVCPPCGVAYSPDADMIACDGCEEERWFHWYQSPSHLVPHPYPMGVQELCGPPPAAARQRQVVLPRLRLGQEEAGQGLPSITVPSFGTRASLAG